MPRVGSFMFFSLHNDNNVTLVVLFGDTTSDNTDASTYIQSLLNFT